MLPVLDAREQIAGAQTIALGSGTLGEDAHKEMIRELNDRAAAPGRRQVRRAKASDMAGMGIGVRVSPAKVG